MGLFDSLFSAKPQAGWTPPFAPPHPNTGGAQVPTTPDTLPVKQGLSGFLDRFVNPQNTLGQFGKALVMAGGSPIGDAYALMERSKRDSEAGALDRTYKEAQIADMQRKATQGPDPTAMQRNYEYLQSIDPKLAESYLGSQADPVSWITATNEDGTKQLYPMQRSGMVGGAPATGAVPGALAPPPTHLASPDSLFNALVQQESGGRAGVIGPQTPYGRAQGRTQMLPATAQEMAQKLGVPWQPEMMTGTSPEAAAYQDRLGRAYLEEGLSKYGGDERKALMYYHGGPNERLWGPKTRAYADQVTKRAGSGQRPDPAALLRQAQAAIAKGADPAKVLERLRGMGGM